MFNLENPIPKEKLVTIKEGETNIIGRIPLILDDDFSIKINSKYSDLWQGSSSGFLNLLSSSLGMPSGQFALQGIQIWESTEPIEISITVKLEMDTDPYLDVINPTKVLMSKSAPKKGSSQVSSKIDPNSNMITKTITNLKLMTLIPPGPNMQAIARAMGGNGNVSEEMSGFLKKFEGGKGVYTVDIGYAHFYSVIIKNVEPTFSKELAYSMSQNKNYPSSASLSLELVTMEVATENMIDKIF